jgi:molecular chaperone DnaK (HSP70)
MSKVIGIDFGTTKTCVAVWEEGRGAKIVRDPHGNKSIPTVVAFADDGQCLVGAKAHRQAVTNVSNTFCGSVNSPARPLIDMSPAQREQLWVRVPEAIELALQN